MSRRLNEDRMPEGEQCPQSVRDVSSEGVTAHQPAPELQNVETEQTLNDLIEIERTASKRSSASFDQISSLAREDAGQTLREIDESLGVLNSRLGQARALASLFHFSLDDCDE